MEFLKYIALSIEFVICFDNGLLFWSHSDLLIANEVEICEYILIIIR